MSYGERSAVVAKHRVEDLSHWQEGTVDAALADPNDSPELVRRVADEDDCSLACGVSDLAHRDGSDVRGGNQLRWHGLARSESGEAEGGDESRRLLRCDPGEGGEFLRPGFPESRDAPEVPGESARGLQAVLSSIAGLKDERNEFLRAEGVHAAAR